MNEQRTANFTSSSIHMLVSDGRKTGSLGKPFFTYVKQKRRERRAGRPIDNEASATPTEWGNMCEPIVHELLGLEYKFHSDKRYYHITLPWSGAPDGSKVQLKSERKVVTDIKSPWTLNSAFDLYDAIEHLTTDSPNQEWANALKVAKKEWYWQLVSNHQLTHSDLCELILFVPKRHMLDKIRRESEKEGYWFHKKTDMELPWLSDDSEIMPITKIIFEPLEEDIKKINDRIELAEHLLDYEGGLTLEAEAEHFMHQKEAA